MKYIIPLRRIPSPTPSLLEMKQRAAVYFGMGLIGWVALWLVHFPDSGF
jgi:hypothetical protein